MMHDRFHTLIVMLASLLMMAAGTGCVEPIAPDNWEQDGMVTLTLQVNAPSASLLTKAPDGQIEDKGIESTLYDLWVWAFNNGESVGSVHKNSFPASAADNDRITLEVPARFIKNNVTSLDIYAMGNGPSANISGDATWKTTDFGTKVIQGDDKVTGFGKKFVQPTDLTKGLPMSYHGTVDISYLKHGFKADQIAFVHTQAQESPDSPYALNNGGLAVSDDQKSYINDKIPNGTWKALDDLLSPKLELLRAVSKLRFLFAKETGLDKTVTIERIQLGVVSNGAISEGVIPQMSYLFPGTFNTTWINDFIWSGSSGNPLLSNEGLLSVEFPMNLRSDSPIADSESGKSPLEMSAQEYELFLAGKWGQVEKGLKTCYLRESSRPLQGIIEYTINKGLADATTKQVTFDLSPISPEGFRRNLSNLVYVYFDSGKRVLVVDVSVLPWDYSKKTVTIAKNDANTLKVDQDGYLIVDPLNTTIDYTHPQIIDNNKVYIVPLPQAPAQVSAHMIVYAPVDGKLRIKPVVKEGSLGSFKLTVKGKDTEKTLNPATDNYLECPIDRAYDRGRIYLYISRADDTPGSLELSFDAVTKEGRVINADSEIIDDRFRFVIPQTTTP